MLIPFTLILVLLLGMVVADWLDRQFVINVICPTCHKEYNANARECPRCRKGEWMKHIKYLVLGLLSLIVLTTVFVILVAVIHQYPVTSLLTTVVLIILFISYFFGELMFSGGRW